MEKISAKMFFTIMWGGLCQAFGQFFGLFGYKREGKFAKCVWGLFATSATIIVAIVAGALVYALWEDVGSKWVRRHQGCTDPECWAISYISPDVYYHNHSDGKAYIFNIHTGEKYLKQIAWIARPNDGDSLVCFSNGKKRGYFSRYTGKVVIEPKYDHAWIFSDGLASVEEDGYIKFIDSTGKVVIDKQTPYIPDMDGYVFHCGYCVVNSDDGESYGLMDKTGKMVLPLEYDEIKLADGYELWTIEKDEKEAVLDKELKTVVPFLEGSIYISEGTIDVTLSDHTMRKYDLNGELINDFYITSVRKLTYEKDDILYRRDSRNAMDSDGDPYEYVTDESYHPEATARLRAYVAGNGYEGLMTADGHVVTMPLYSDIEALDHDLYLCTVTNGDKVIVNGKGQIVK